MNDGTPKKGASNRSGWSDEEIVKFLFQFAPTIGSVTDEQLPDGRTRDATSHMLRRLKAKYGEGTAGKEPGTPKKRKKRADKDEVTGSPSKRQAAEV